MEQARVCRREVRETLPTTAYIRGTINKSAWIWRPEATNLDTRMDGQASGQHKASNLVVAI